MSGNRGMPEGRESGSTAKVQSQPPAEAPANRSAYSWALEGSQNRPALTVKEASVVFGMENGMVGPLLVNLVFLNPSDRPIEILWSESSISAGSGSQRLALGLSPSMQAPEAAQNIIVPAQGQYAQSVAPIDSVVSDSSSGSPRLTCMPQTILRVRIIYRASPGEIPSAFSIVLTPSSGR